MQAAKPVWDVYNGEVIPLSKGDTLMVNAMRIGFLPAVITYKDGQVIAGK